MLQKLKPYLFSLALIGIGAALIALVWKVNINWVALPVFIAGAILIIVGLQIASNIAEAYTKESPDFIKPLAYTSFFERMVHYAGYAAAISAFFIIKLQGRRLENLIGVEFFFMSVPTAILIAILFYHGLKKAYPGFFKTNKERQSSILGLCCAVAMWSIYGMAVYNEYHAPVRVEKVFVVKKSKNAMYGTPFLFLHIKDKRERFSPSKREWKEIEAEDSIYVTIVEGKLGYEAITEFKALPASTIKQPQITH